MIEIARPMLLAELWRLSQDGSVFVHGAPGSGKSWLIRQFLIECQRQSRKVLPLVAEDYQIKSAQELSESLGFSEPIPSLMSRMGAHSVLVIDGLDALRGEVSQRAFRELITDVLRRSPTTSVIASIRTYDLQESREFPKLVKPTSSPGAAGLTKLVVDDLNDSELGSIIRTNPQMKALFNNAPVAVRQLLRNPFNLNLAVGLLQEGMDVGEFSKMTSQIQLLGKYWHRRVESTGLGPLRQHLLQDATQKMVESKVLSLPEAEISLPGYNDALQDLLSQEVINKGSTNRVAFGHNILFDYAVARLLLDEVRLTSFIIAEPSRTLFFRPSLTMFFHHLWFTDRALFWRVSRKCDDSHELPERAKVISGVVICEGARSINDLDDLLIVTNGIPSWLFLARTLRAALAVGVLQSKLRQLWLNFLLRLSVQMRLEYVNEVIALLTSAMTVTFSTDRAIIGKASQNVIEWAIAPPNGLSNDQAVELCSVVVGRLLPTVTATYDTAPIATSALIRQILARIGSPRSASKEVFWIAHEISTIARQDPILAKDVYIQMYRYAEESEETTRIGGNAAIGTFTSTKKQDYNTALYGLMSRFAVFLDSSPIDAAEAAIVAVESEIERERVRQDSHAQEITTFRLEGGFIRYRPDFSEIWDGGSSGEYTSLNLLGAALGHAAEASQAIRDKMIDVMITRATLGISWKRLVEAAGRHPEAFYQQVKALLFISRFISAPEVTVAVGELLRESYSRHLVSSEDAVRIEGAITRVGKSRFIRRYERASSIQRRLLSCIRMEDIVSPVLAAKKRRWEASDKHVNKPFHRVTFGAFVPGPDDWLREEGVDSTAPVNALVLQLKNRLATFEGKFLNAMPSVEDCDLIADDFYALHAIVKVSDAAEEILENARGTLIAASKMIAKNPALGPTSRLIREAREVAIEGSVDPSPKFDPKYHGSFDSPGWGAPVPRIEAGQALGQLILNFFADEEIVNTFCSLRGDPVPAVRFQVAHWLPALYKHNLRTKFWDTLFEMLRAEPTHAVMLVLLQAIGQVCGSEPDRALDAVELVMARGLPITNRSEASRALIEVPLALYVVRNIDRARNILRFFEAKISTYSRELLDGIFVASHYLTPAKEAESRVRERAREFFANIIALAKAGLSRGQMDDADPKIVEDCLKILDAAATRIVFAFGLDQHAVSGDDVLSPKERRSLYTEMHPLLRQLADTPGGKTTNPMLPRTAYYLLQLMNGLLSIDPVEVLSLAAAICQAGSIFRFETDVSARDEAIKLVETVLADHRDSLKDSAESVGSLLDIFSKAGWSEAIALTFRLDEAFR